MQVTVTKKQLKAMLLFTCKRKIRYPLNNLLIETFFDGKPPIVVASDRVRLSVLQLPQDNNVKEESHGSIILAARFVQAIVNCGQSSIECCECGTARQSEHHLDDPVELRLEKGRCMAIIGKDREFVLSSPKAAINAEYPKWRHLFPEESSVDGKRVFFDPQFMPDYAEAARLMYGTGNAIWVQQINQDSPIIIRYPGHRDFISLLMPVASKEGGAVNNENFICDYL